MPIVHKYPQCWIAFGDDALKIAGVCQPIYGPPHKWTALNWSRYKGEPIFGFDLNLLEEVLAKCREAGIKIKLEQTERLVAQRKSSGLIPHRSMVQSHPSRKVQMFDLS